MFIFHANVNKMQTPWVPRIFVWIKGTSNRGACSVLVVRRHLLEANTYTYWNRDLDNVLVEHGWPQTIANSQMCIPAAHVAESGGIWKYSAAMLVWEPQTILPWGHSDRKWGCLNPLSQPCPNLEITFHIYIFSHPPIFWLMQTAV